ncbi:MAG: hypothetical protein IJK42_02770 [Prevotella sp.]|nr:hypothetical protein [Prevotella sp.]
MAIFTLTSELHDEKAIATATWDFLKSLRQASKMEWMGEDPYLFMGNDYTDYGTHALDIIYVRTGGTEGIFKNMLPELRKKSKRPFYLLTSGKSNSLAASLEILSFLCQQGIKGEVIHGKADFIAKRIDTLAKVGKARRELNGCRLGIIGKPSDWLIASHADPELVKETLGINLIDIPMQELLEEIAATPLREVDETTTEESIKKALPGANQIYEALKAIIERHRLQGFTIRCFDLLTAVHNTGCLALARLNAEGIVAGCEGDVPTMLTMKITQSLVGMTGFQANPSAIDPETGELLFAHCTIPFNMVERYEYDTHFESGIGVGIRGFMKEGPVTIFKVSGDLSRHFVAQGDLVRNQAQPDLCRTQQVIQLEDPTVANYFLKDPIGNHHVILPGHHAELIQSFVEQP